MAINPNPCAKEAAAASRTGHQSIVKLRVSSEGASEYAHIGFWQQKNAEAMRPLRIVFAS
jgi:hypothetical protein